MDKSAIKSGRCAVKKKRDKELNGLGGSDLQWCTKKTETVVKNGLVNGVSETEDIPIATQKPKGKKKSKVRRAGANRAADSTTEDSNSNCVESGKGSAVGSEPTVFVEVSNGKEADCDLREDMVRHRCEGEARTSCEGECLVVVTDISDV